MRKQTSGRTSEIIIAAKKDTTHIEVSKNYDFKATAGYFKTSLFCGIERFSLYQPKIRHSDGIAVHKPYVVNRESLV